jgi:putative methionine-R-sulfoxide reductase with GAF domain
MAEDLCISNGSKEEKYRTLLPQIKCLIADENDLIANLANVAAALKETFGFFWVGFYLVKGEELVLAPFQGPVACTRIKKGRGVCGKHGKELKHWLCRMWMLFRGILRVALCRVRRLWFRFFGQVGKYGVCWMWTAKV